MSKVELLPNHTMNNKEFCPVGSFKRCGKPLRAQVRQGTVDRELGLCEVNYICKKHGIVGQRDARINKRGFAIPFGELKAGR